MARRVKGSGGVIVVSNTGDIGINFTTERMPWAHITDHVLHSGLDPGDDVVEHLNSANHR